MRAIGISRYGDASVLEDWDVAVPIAGPGEAVVEVHYADINFMDIHTRQGKYANSSTYPVRLPVTLGMEGAGVVRSVGPGVIDVVDGDRVAWCLSWGSYAQYALVPVSRLATLPDALDLRLAAATLFQGCTAHYLVNDVAMLQPGVTCLVHAASGSIGSLLVQMSHQRGARVLATASSPSKADAARASGADEIFSYGDGRFADDVLGATQGRGVDVTFDALGETTLRDSFRATRTRGVVINYGSVAGSVRDLDPVELGEAGSLWLTRPRLADYISDRDTVQRRADDVFEALLVKELRVTLAGEYGFDSVRDAHAHLEGRHQIGKAVLRVI